MTALCLTSLEIIQQSYMVIDVLLPAACQLEADNGTARRPPDHRKETQTVVVWSCLMIIRSGQIHPKQTRD